VGVKKESTKAKHKTQRPSDICEAASITTTSSTI